jgi:hypothetical protein
MSCPSVPIHSKIITLAIIAHGSISALNLDTETQHVFDNVRLFSKAGGTQGLASTSMVEYNTLAPLYARFKRDLAPEETTFQIMQQYAKDISSKYENLINFFEANELDIEKSCKIYNPVTYDKDIAILPPTLLERIASCISPRIQGVYVVSMHEKVDDAGTLKLIFPKDGTNNVNLANPAEFKTFATALGRTESSLQTDIFSKVAKGVRTIKMGELVRIVKSLIAPNECYINIIDDTCSVLNPKFVSPEESAYFSKYIVPSDIEMGEFKRWGGKLRRKMKTKRKQKQTKQKQTKQKRKK